MQRWLGNTFSNEDTTLYKLYWQKAGGGLKIGV